MTPRNQKRSIDALNFMKQYTTILPLYRLFPMNFLFVKLSQNCGDVSALSISNVSCCHGLTLDGPSPPGYNLACSRTAISCRTCEMYLIGNISNWSRNVLFTGTMVHVRPQALRILAVAWGLKGLVQRERDVTWNGEAVQSGIDQSLSSSYVSNSSKIRCDKSWQHLPSQPPGHSS